MANRNFHVTFGSFFAHFLIVITFDDLNINVHLYSSSFQYQNHKRSETFRMENGLSIGFPFANCIPASHVSGKAIAVPIQRSIIISAQIHVIFHTIIAAR